jgi:hypothetical protein
VREERKERLPARILANYRAGFFATGWLRQGFETDVGLPGGPTKEILKNVLRRKSSHCPVCFLLTWDNNLASPI